MQSRSQSGLLGQDSYGFYRRGPNRLEISQTSAELSGTHIVAGDSSSGSDPTAITLRGLAAHTGVNTPVALSLGLLGMIAISLALVWRAQRLMLSPVAASD